MPGAQSARRSDVVQFRKFVRLMDSDAIGERNAAFTQAMQFCAQQTPPVLFSEAVCLAFGTSKEQLEQLEAEKAQLAGTVEELELKLQQRSGETARLAEQFVEAKARIERLAKEKAGREEGMVELPKWLSDILRMPPVCLLLANIMLGSQIWICSEFENNSIPVLDVLVNVGLLPFTLWLFVAWVNLQFRKEGLLQLFIKGCFVSVGIVSAIYALAFRWPSWSELLAHGGPHVTSIAEALLFLTISYLLAVSRLSELTVEHAVTPLLNSVVRKGF